MITRGGKQRNSGGGINAYQPMPLVTIKGVKGQKLTAEFDLCYVVNCGGYEGSYTYSDKYLCVDGDQMLQSWNLVAWVTATTNWGY